RARASYDDDVEWISMLKVSLDSAIPFYYTGQSVGGGHAFVCDGYDSEDYFHINWGWGAIGKEKCDGYFLIQVLDPEYGGIGAGSGGYTGEQYVMYNMVPSGSEKLLADNYRITANDAIRGGISATDTVGEIKVKLTTLVNWTAADFRGKAALAVYKDGEFVKIISDEAYLLLDGVLTKGSIAVQPNKILNLTARSQDLEDGDYDIWVVFRSNREGAQWIKMHGSRSRITDKSYIAVRVVDGKFTLRSESCKVNIDIVTSAKKTIRYWFCDNFGRELYTGQSTNKRVILDVLKGVDYTFKCYVEGYDTASLRFTTVQDTSLEVKMKQVLGLPHIYSVRVMDG
ncbi:MAG: C10 family peptidase, partial [Bacteroidales bacterium]|nr:C10 family peptidase [Bacteroidales bacterium]